MKATTGRQLLEKAKSSIAAAFAEKTDDEMVVIMSCLHALCDGCSPDIFASLTRTIVLLAFAEVMEIFCERRLKDIASRN